MPRKENLEEMENDNKATFQQNHIYGSKTHLIEALNLPISHGLQFLESFHQG